MFAKFLLTCTANPAQTWQISAVMSAQSHKLSTLIFLFVYSCRCPCLFHLLGSLSCAKAALRHLLWLWLEICYRRCLCPNQWKIILHYRMLLLLFVHCESNSIQRPLRQIQVSTIFFVVICFILIVGFQTFSVCTVNIWMQDLNAMTL